LSKSSICQLSLRQDLQQAAFSYGQASKQYEGIEMNNTNLNSILGEKLLSGGGSIIYRNGIAHKNKYILWENVEKIYISGSINTINSIIPSGEHRELRIVDINNKEIDFSFNGVFRMRSEDKEQFSACYSLILQKVTHRQWTQFIHKLQNGERHSYRGFEIAQDAFYFHKSFGGYDKKDIAYIIGCSMNAGAFYIHYQEPYKKPKAKFVGSIAGIPNVHLVQSYINMIMKDRNSRSDTDNGRQPFHITSVDETGVSSTPSLSLAKPKPEVHPTIIQFLDLIPGEARKDTFIIKNSGGAYSKIWLNNSNLLINIVSQKPLSDTGELPILVEVEVKGADWGKSYVDNIIVRLDDVETQVRVEVHSRPKIQQTNQRSQAEEERTRSPNIESQISDSSREQEGVDDNPKPEPNISPKTHQEWRRWNLHTSTRLVQPAGTLALTLIGTLGIPAGLIYGIVKLFTSAQNHLEYFSPAFMSFMVLCAFIVDYNKGGKRGNLLVLWILGCISALASIFIPVVRWFFIALDVVIAIILIVRYTNRTEKSETKLG